MSVTPVRPLVDVASADMVAVEAAIEAVFARKRVAARAYGAEAERLWAAASDTVRAGKGVRPRLLLAAFKAITGAPRASAAAIDAAAAVELLHYAFLRPHDSLRGRTPAEVYNGFELEPLVTTPPLRGRLGEARGDPGLRVAMLDERLGLPVLLPRAA